jgi:hypothetical protein
MELWRSLPDEIKVTLLILALAGGFMLGLNLLGRLITFRRPGSGLPFFMSMGGLAFMIFSTSLMLDRQPTLPAVVEARSEALEVDDYGGWKNDLRLQVRYTPPGARTPRSESLRADAALFDRASVGDTVQVRYLHLGGLFKFSRVSERTTLSILLGWQDGAPLALMGVGFLTLMGGMSAGRLKGVMLVVGLMILATGLFISQTKAQLHAARPLLGQQASGRATVHQVQRFTEVGSGSSESGPDPVAQHFDVVHLVFLPPGWPDPVMTADIIDADSLQLEMGMQVPVSYLVGQPRRVRLEGGTRSYAWKNALLAMSTLAILSLLLGSTLAFTWVKQLREWAETRAANRIVEDSQQRAVR